MTLTSSLWLQNRRTRQNSDEVYSIYYLTTLIDSKYTDKYRKALRCAYGKKKSWNYWVAARLKRKPSVRYWWSETLLACPSAGCWLTVQRWLEYRVHLVFCHSQLDFNCIRSISLTAKLTDLILSTKWLPLACLRCFLPVLIAKLSTSVCKRVPYSQLYVFICIYLLVEVCIYELWRQKRRM